MKAVCVKWPLVIHPLRGTSHLTLHADDLSIRSLERNPMNVKKCDKIFKWPSYLQDHERSHTGEKPYECKQCGKTFSLPVYCRRHAQTHTRKKHVCEQCGHAFRCSSAAVWLGTIRSHLSKETNFIFRTTHAKQNSLSGKTLRASTATTGFPQASLSHTSFSPPPTILLLLRPIGWVTWAEPKKSPNEQLRGLKGQGNSPMSITAEEPIS
ncbi:hypothetical protein GHT09_010544 [Marmota monax]|uniref:C2H2-type domain-containing protein n=1 Tax=Marmota monax TaxID=9995 RepID=A0A834QGZ9_MARMO|nr:hypothetical protein GHT09_010544 [Marmota monax]